MAIQSVLTQRTCGKRPLRPYFGLVLPSSDPLREMKDDQILSQVVVQITGRGSHAGVLLGSLQELEAF